MLGNDGAGRTWLVAVTSGGATFAQRLERGRLVRLPGDSAAVTSTPGADRAADGTTYLHQVSAAGRLGVRTLVGRRWSRAAAIDGDWSPYASPAVGELAGRLHVAPSTATARSSSVPPCRANAPAPGPRPLGRRPHPLPRLVTRSNAGVFVVAGGDGSPRLLTRPASAVAGTSSPTRAGFTP